MVGEKAVWVLEQLNILKTIFKSYLFLGVHVYVAWHIRHVQEDNLEAIGFLPLPYLMQGLNSGS